MEEKKKGSLTLTSPPKPGAGEHDYLKVIIAKKDREGIKDRCGKNIVADGLCCPYCDCFETYKDGNDKMNTDKWYFMIQTYRLDDKSKCNNCGQWFSRDIW